MTAAARLLASSAIAATDLVIATVNNGHMIEMQKLSKFFEQANPDIIYVVDRTAVMEHRPVMTAEQMANPLLRQTNAWKNGRVVFVDADAWYITAASVTSLKRVIDDVLRGYK